MNTSSDSYDFIIEQVLRGREAIGTALGHTQDVGQVGLDLDQVNRILAKAIQFLFFSQKQQITFRDVDSAMDCLRETLTLLQNVPASDNALDVVTSTVAKTLAILFPVSKALEKKEADFQIEKPLDLVRPRNSQIEAGSDNANLERRQVERKQFEVDIGLQSECNFYTGFSMDISSGGLFVATYDLFDVGVEVNVNFKLPKGPMMSLDGLIRWLRVYNDMTPEMVPGVGVMFTSLTKKQERAINRYLKRCEPFFFEQ